MFIVLATFDNGARPGTCRIIRGVKFAKNITSFGEEFFCYERQLSKPRMMARWNGEDEEYECDTMVKAWSLSNLRTRYDVVYVMDGTTIKEI